MTTTTTTDRRRILRALATLAEMTREDLLGRPWAEAVERCDRPALKLHAAGIVNDVLRIVEDPRCPSPCYAPWPVSPGSS